MSQANTDLLRGFVLSLSVKRKGSVEISTLGTDAIQLTFDISMRIRTGVRSVASGLASGGWRIQRGSENIGCFIVSITGSTCVNICANIASGSKR